jgi:hypothetical protein
MAVAMLSPAKHQGKKDTSAKIAEVKERYLRMARTAFVQTPELAQAVLAGTTMLAGRVSLKNAL